MTRLPHENRGVKGVPGPGYVMGALCVVPGCDLLGIENHHVWRRSFLIGAYFWVELPDKAIVGNVVPMCGAHHRMVTENKALILYDDGVFYWDTHESQARLLWQPPFYASMEAFRLELAMGTIERAPKDLSFENPPEKNEEEWTTSAKSSGSPPQPTQNKSLLPSGAAGHDTESGAHVSALCPTCQQPIKPKLKTKRERSLNRRTWSIAVPADQQENGAEVLDVLLEEARLELARQGLPYGDEGTVKYHILATSMALFVTHAKEML